MAEIEGGKSIQNKCMKTIRDYHFRISLQCCLRNVHKIIYSRKVSTKMCPSILTVKASNDSCSHNSQSGHIFATIH